MSNKILEGRVWVSSMPNGGWRTHGANKKLYVPSREGAIERAQEIAKRMEPYIQAEKKRLEETGVILYGRDPFPPR